ncbi:MAG: hypothetical protein WCX71_03165 [Candidatus Buchananbacteria bacterium]
MRKKSILLSVTVTAIVVLAIGIAIPKLTVYDKIPVDKSFRKNVMQALNVHYDNPLERLALWLGKSRIVSAMPLSAEVESFTLFRIPLGFFRGIPDMRLSIFFNLAGDWSAKVNSDVIGFSPKLFIPIPDEVPLGWYAHQLSDSRIILTKQKILPNIGNTEGYAYGDQINISVLKFDKDPKRPEDWPQLAWTEDQVLVKEKSWTNVSGMTALRVRHDPGGASGGQITWYLFDNDRVYELSLYLPSDPPNDETFSKFVYHYGEQISQQATTTQNINSNSLNSLAEKLAECLPKSDMASHEICNELLKQIIDFESCAKAGFSIMKSNPPQCQTPDGRNFVERSK